MKRAEVAIGGTYTAKVSGKVVRICIDGESPYGGWDATNLETNKKVRIKSAQRLRGTAGSTRTKTSKKNRSKPMDSNTTVETTASDVCATLGCKQPAVLTYLGRPRCQKCWESECPSNEAATPDITPTVEIVTGQPLPKRMAKPKAEPKPKRVSALDAAAEVLRTATEPMASKALVDAMAQRGLWSSPNGKTPDATLYAAILREINIKGAAARFRKVERGKFNLLRDSTML